METSIRPVVSIWTQRDNQWLNVEDAGTRSLDIVREEIRTNKLPPAFAEIRVNIGSRIFCGGIEGLSRVDKFVDQCVNDACLDKKPKAWVWSSECKKVEQQDAIAEKSGVEKAPRPAKKQPLKKSKD